MFILLVIQLVVNSPPALASHAPGEVIVRFRPGTPKKDSAALLRTLGARERGRIPALDARLLKLPPGKSVEDAIRDLERNPNVASVEPNGILVPVDLPVEDDSLFALQWAIDKVSATRSWSENIPGSVGVHPVIIAIVDTGISPTHEDLAANLLPGFDVANTTTFTGDSCGHGTAMAGIAAAVTNNGKGVAGIAWPANVRLLPIKISSTSCATTEFDIANGIAWAVNAGAHVINISFSSCLSAIDCGEPTDLGRAAAEYAYQRGVIIVAAAGNESTSLPSYPAAYPRVIAVSATDRNDALATFSNYGRYIDIAAPGVALLTTGQPSDPAAGNFECISKTFGTAISNASYCFATGTSPAAPVVSGLAAVLIAQNPSRTPYDIESIIKRTADQVMGPGWNMYVGYGRVNMYRALTDTRNPVPTNMDLAYVYPNPFYGTSGSTMSFIIRAVPGDTVKVEVFDILGNRVWKRSLSAQDTAVMDLTHNSAVQWNGMDEQGRVLPNGVYMARIEVNSSRTIKKIVIAR